MKFSHMLQHEDIRLNEIRHTHTHKYCKIPLISSTWNKFLKTENTIEVTGGWGERGNRLLGNKYRVPVGDDGNGSGGGCTML